MEKPKRDNEVDGEDGCGGERSGRTAMTPRKWIGICRDVLTRLRPEWELGVRADAVLCGQRTTKTRVTGWMRRRKDGGCGVRGWDVNVNVSEGGQRSGRRRQDRERHAKRSTIRWIVVADSAIAQRRDVDEKTRRGDGTGTDQRQRNRGKGM